MDRRADSCLGKELQRSGMNTAKDRIYQKYETNKTSQDDQPFPGKTLTSNTLFQIQNILNTQIMKSTTSKSRA